MATFHLQKDGQHFQVEAADRDEAIAKVQAHLGGQQEAPAPAPTDGAPLFSDDLLGQQIADTSELLAPGAQRTPDGIAMLDGRVLPEGHPDTLHPSNPNSTAAAQQQSVGSQLVDTGKVALGIMDVGATLATGAVAEPVAGIAGLLTHMVADNDTAADVVNWVSDAGTWEPKTQVGQGILETAAVPLMKLDMAIDDWAVDKSGGNAALATAIKTGIYGSLEALGLRKLTRGQVANARQLKADIDDARVRMEEIGVKPRQNELFQGVVNAADEITLDAKGEAIPAVRTALRELHDERKAQVDIKFEQARQRAALVQTGEVAAFARNMRDSLQMDGFSTNRRPILENTLRDLEDFGKVNPMTGKPRTRIADAADLRQFEILRRQIVQNLDGMPRGADRTGLQRIKNGMDDFLDQQLQQDLITGDSTAIAKWREARDAHRIFSEDFRQDKFIQDMMSTAKTPEELTNIVLGTAQIAKPVSGHIVKRLKEVLGDDNPVLRSINQEMQFRILEPLLVQNPTANSMQQFVRRYDNIVKNNRSLVDEIGLDSRRLESLRRAADTASSLPNAPMAFAGLDFPSVMSRIIFGNKLAKATLRVNFFRNVLRTMFGRDRVSQRQILADLAGVEMDAGNILNDPNRAANLIAPFAIADSARLIQEAQEDRSR